MKASAAGTRGGPKAAFRVVMVYDDFAAGKRAMDTCQFLLSQLGGEARLNSSMWKFDVLRCSKLKQMAVEDALEADVVIVANGQNSGLPEEVIDWLMCWAPLRRSEAAALVGLIDYTGEDPSEPAQAQAFLKAAAARAGMDFLAQEIHATDPPEPFSPRLMPPLIPLPPQDLPPVRPSAEGWGLND